MIGLVGACILALALAGVVRFELMTSRGGFDVSFPTQVEAAGEEDGTLAPGADARVAFALSRPNVTRVDWVLTWGDDVGAPDTFRLEVTSPSGETRRVEGDRERLALAFEGLAVAPPPIVLTGSEAAVQARLAGLASDGASGTWSATVTLVRAQGQGAGGVDVLPDEGNAWTLAARTSAYEARLEPR